MVLAEGPPRMVCSLLVRSCQSVLEAVPFLHQKVDGGAIKAQTH